MKISFRTDSKEIKSIVEQINKQQITVGEYLQNIIQAKNEEKGSKVKIREHLSSQRQFSWEVWRSSNLIQSILLGIPIPEITVYRQDDKSQYRVILDGQCRLTSLYLFINNQFKLDLSKSVFPNFEIEGKQYMYTDLQGKTFSELPELLQDIILNYDLRITTINNCTEEEAEKFFVSMNAGVKPLRPAEVRKAAMGISVRKLFTETLTADWVLHVLTEKTAKGNTGNEIMAQVLTLLHSGEAIELSKENIDKVIYGFRQSGVPDSLQNDISAISDYLNKVTAIWIENKKKTDEAQTVKRGKRVSNYATYRFNQFNKTNIVMLLVAANKAIKNNVNLKAFAEWSLEFFKNPSQDYRRGTEGGKVNELGKVDMRMMAIDAEIENLVKDEVLDIQGEQVQQDNTDTDNTWTEQDDEQDQDQDQVV
jgi:phage-related protein